MEEKIEGKKEEKKKKTGGKAEGRQTWIHLLQNM